MFEIKILNDNIGRRSLNYKKQVSVSVDRVGDVDEQDFNVLVQIEPSEIINNKEKIIKNKNRYELILAWDDDILNACENSVLFPFGTGWVKDTKVDIADKQDVSFLYSWKTSCVGHRLRQECARMLPVTTQSGLVVKKHRSPPRIEKKEDFLKPFLFSIIIENVSSKNWFTEKLIDCFLTKTIPIYWGCPNIKSFFNIDGIIFFDDVRDLNNKINFLNKNKYIDMLDAVEENYKLALGYVDIWERIDSEIKKALV